MPEPLVSVIIPCYNAAPWLEQTLRSVQAQTWSRLEIILVDDGSKDNSLQIARRYADTRMHVVAQSNAGQSAALNRGLQDAQGDYIEFLDADDLLHADKLRLQLTRLREAPAGCIASGEWARFSSSPEEAVFIPEKIWTDLDPVSWLSRSWSGEGMMHGAAWLLPASVVRKAGPWSEDLFLVNDFDFFSRALLCSPQVVFCPGARTYYRTGNTHSLSASKGIKAWTSAYNAFSRGTQSLLKSEDSERTRKAAAITFQSLAYQAWPEAPQIVRLAEQEVAALGGCALPLRSGRLFNLIADTVGWKTARRLQHLWRTTRSKTP